MIKNRNRLIVLITLLVFLMSSCSGSSKKKNLDLASIEITTLSELEEVQSVWISDRSGAFSYITAQAYDETIFFDREYEFTDNIFIYSAKVNNETKYGYMDQYFQKLTDPIFAEPIIFGYGYARVTDGERSFVIDENFVEVEEYYPGFILLGNNLMFVEASVKEPANPKVISDIDIKTYLVPVNMYEGSDDTNKKPLYGYKTLEDMKKGIGDFIIAPAYDSAELFSEGFAAVEVNGQWGYIDETGRMVIEAEYDEAEMFKNGLAAVYDANYHQPGVLKLGYTNGQDLGRWGMINMNGNSVTTFDYRYITPFENDMAFAVIATNPDHGNGAGLYNVLKPDGTKLFSAGLIFGNARYFTGEPTPFSDGYMLVGSGDFTYINEFGERINEEEYDNARPFDSGRAAVKPENSLRWGYIDTSGTMVLPADYIYAGDFDDGYAYVKENLSGVGYLIDTIGNTYLAELDLDGISKFNEDGNALAFKKETTSVSITNEKTGLDEWMTVELYTYYIIHIN